MKVDREHPGLGHSSATPAQWRRSVPIVRIAPASTPPAAACLGPDDAAVDDELDRRSPSARDVSHRSATRAGHSANP